MYVANQNNTEAGLLSPAAMIFNHALASNRSYLTFEFMSEAIAEYFARQLVNLKFGPGVLTNEQFQKKYNEACQAYIDAFKADGGESSLIEKKDASGLSAHIAQKINAEFTVDPNEPVQVSQQYFVPRFGWTNDGNSWISVKDFIANVIAENKPKPKRTA